MNTFEAKNRKEWRKWLENNHSDTNEIWLVYFKKHTNKPTITYMESVEEAICFGWIDGIKKRIDDERYTHRFTPRRKNSKWSPVNIKVAKAMIKVDLMTKEGLRAFERRKEYNSDILKVRFSSVDDIPIEFEEKLRENKTAWKNFTSLAPGHKRQYILWMNSAKRKETKQKRYSEAIKLLEQGKKLGMK